MRIDRVGLGETTGALGEITSLAGVGDHDGDLGSHHGDCRGHLEAPSRLEHDQRGSYLLETSHQLLDPGLVVVKPPDFLLVGSGHVEMSLSYIDAYEDRLRSHFWPPALGG